MEIIQQLNGHLLFAFKCKVCVKNFGCMGMFISEKPVWWCFEDLRQVRCPNCQTIASLEEEKKAFDQAVQSDQLVK